MPDRPHENIILVGFMGSGKSSIGRLVARKVGFQFLDTDQLIVDRSGSTIPEIFAGAGEAHFRDLETGVLESLEHMRRCVIATGGGAVVREQNRELLRRRGFVAQLTAEESVIFERVMRNTKRPLLQTADPLETMRSLLASRAPLYADVAHWTLDTSALTHEQAAIEVIAQARKVFSWHRAA